MPKAYGQILTLTATPEPDGSRILEVQDFGGEKFEVLIPESLVGQLVRDLQSEQIKRAYELSQNATFPLLKLLSASKASQGTQTELMVETAQTGSFVLLADDDDLKRLKDQIEQVLLGRSGPKNLQ